MRTQSSIRNDLVYVEQLLVVAFKYPGQFTPQQHKLMKMNRYQLLVELQQVQLKTFKKERRTS